MKRTKPNVHICRFIGKRVAKQRPRKGTRCELSDDDAPIGANGWPPQCRRRAVCFVVYQWGGAALCEKHAREETTP